MIEGKDLCYDRIVMIKLAIDDKIITILSCYTPQVGLDNIIKDTFCDKLQNTIRKVGAYETFVVCDDLNNHTGKLANGYEGVHSGYGYGLRNKEGEHILEFAGAHNLVVGNSYLFHQERQPSDHLPIRWY